MAHTHGSGSDGDNYTEMPGARNDGAYERGLMVLLAGGGILQNPAASKTGSSSRTRPPSSMLKCAQNVFAITIPNAGNYATPPYSPAHRPTYRPRRVAIFAAVSCGKFDSVGKNVAP